MDTGDDTTDDTSNYSSKETSFNFNQLDTIETFFAFLQFEDPVLSFFLSLIPLVGGATIVARGKRSLNILFTVFWTFLVLFLIILLLVLMFNEFLIVNNIVLVLIIFVWLAVWLGVVIARKFKEFQVYVLVAWSFGLLFNCLFNLLWLSVVLSAVLLIA